MPARRIGTTVIFLPAIFSTGPCHTSLDLVGFEGRSGGFIGQQGADFLSEFTKILGADVGTAHQAELVADQRMADLTSGHGGSGGGQKNRARLIYSACAVLWSFCTLVHKRLICDERMRTFARFSKMHPGERHVR
jgi:hypothetical protein